MGGGCFGLPRSNRNALGFVKKAGWRNKQELQTLFVLRPQGWIERQHRNKIKKKKLPGIFLHFQNVMAKICFCI